MNKKKAMVCAIKKDHSKVTMNKTAAKRAKQHIQIHWQ